MLGTIRCPLNHCSLQDENKSGIVYGGEGGLKWQIAKLVLGGTIYMYKEHSIVNTGNVNADFPTGSQLVFSVEQAYCPPNSPIFFDLDTE